MTPRDHGRSIRKLELEGDLEDQFFKMEFENSFCQDTDASFDYKFTVFPKSLNPGFDLMCVIKVSAKIQKVATIGFLIRTPFLKGKKSDYNQFQYGSQLRGCYYNDFSTVRIRDMARVKSPKMMLCKSKIELSLVRPGLIAAQDKVASVKMNEERMDLLKITAIAKARGTCSSSYT